MTDSTREPERTLWEGRPSFWNWAGCLAIGDLCLLLLGALWWIGETRWTAPVAALGVVAYLGALVGRAGVHYTLTSQRVIARTGIFSKRVDEVEIVDIRNIVLEQTLFERVCGIGTVSIASSGGDGIEVRFEGVNAPTELKERVREARLAPKGERPEVFR